METHKIQTIARRDRENTVCIIEATCKNEIENSLDLFNALVKGMTEWVEVSQEGLDWYQGTVEDANIGDLACFLDTEFRGNSLEDFHEGFVEYHLIKNGILNLKLQVIDISRNECDWYYDRHIVDYDKLAESGRV